MTATPTPGFLRSGRWIPIVLFVVAMSVACVLLARWQIDRLDGKRAANAEIVRNQDQPPTTLDEVAAQQSQDRDVTWSAVTATGTYGDQKLARKRTLSGQVGYYVLSELTSPQGEVWVARGWIPAGSDALTPSAVPPVPDGSVTVTGLVRDWEGLEDETGLPRTQVQRINPESLDSGNADAGFWIQALNEDPAGAPITRIPPPEISEGPHLSYALQWSLFAFMALAGGFVILRRQREYFAEDVAAAYAARGEEQQ